MFRHHLARKLAATLAAILILAAGCSEQGPTSVELASSDVAAADLATSLAGKAKIAKAEYTAGSYSAVIGPEGGKLRFGIGELDVPAGAVDREIVFTAKTDGSTLGVEFGPHGTVFNPDAKPTLTFDAKGFQGDLAGLLILYVDDAGSILETITSFGDLGAKKISGQIGHFSKFCLGEGR